MEVCVPIPTRLLHSFDDLEVKEQLDQGFTYHSPKKEIRAP